MTLACTLAPFIAASFPMSVTAESVKQEGGRVLVHCMTGVSRYVLTKQVVFWDVKGL